MSSLPRLSYAQDFAALFRRGKKFDYRFFRLAVRRNNLPGPRFAFIAPRTLSKSALRRNRLRRRTREWIRVHALGRIPPLDIAVVFKKDAVGSPSKIFYEELEKAFKSIPG